MNRFHNLLTNKNKTGSSLEKSDRNYLNKGVGERVKVYMLFKYVTSSI